jgi:hypothetical protein
MVKAESTRATEAKIKRLTTEILAIDRFFYGSEENGDSSLHAGMFDLAPGIRIP